MTPATHGDPPARYALAVLVVNTGSSSLKLRVVDPSDQVVAGADVDRWDWSARRAPLVGCWLPAMARLPTRSKRTWSSASQIVVREPSRQTYTVLRSVTAAADAQ